MWNSWFPSVFSRQNKATNNANLQQRILTLMEGTKEIEKNDSPTLNELKNQKNKVKRMSSCYEENIEARFPSEARNNNIKLDKTPFSERLENILEADKDQTSYISFANTTLFFTPKTPTWQTSKLEELIQHFIKSDASYIEQMEQLITKFVNELDNIPAFRSVVPAMKTTQKEHMFGRIEKIYELHKERFHPMLLQCGNDILMLANILIDLCKEGFFNSYIIYALDEKTIEHRRNVFYRNFIDGITDKVGFPFVFSPVQQMALYHLIIINIISQLCKTEAPQEQIVAMSTAEIHLKALMNKIYAMRNIS